MLKNRKKQFIIKLIYISISVLFSGMLFASSETINYEIKPKYSFANKGGRDIFTPRNDMEVNYMERVDISALRLNGISGINGTKAALFGTKSSSEFGYVFMNGALLGENEEIVQGITGEVRNDKEVMLRQGDKEILFKLPDDNASEVNINGNRSE